jgi:hypothetical protein
MIRVSREQLAERWALTYSQDGYDVRAEHVPGHRYPQPTSGVVPDLEALKGRERVLVHIIDSPESLEDSDRRTDLEKLNKACGGDTRLHIVVAAECARGIKERLEAWHVHPTLVHVT